MLTAKGFLFHTVVGGGGGGGNRWYGNSGRLSESFEIAFLYPNLNDSVVVGQLRVNNNNTNWFSTRQGHRELSGDESKSLCMVILEIITDPGSKNYTGSYNLW